MGNGTTQAEILLIQTVGPITILLRNIAIPGIFHIFLCNFQTSIWLTFVLDVLLVVLPIILILTLLSDYIPMYGFIATAIAILAVDFDVFPNRFAKTSTFGRSLMDLGTATFVYCFAVVDVFRHYPGRVLLLKASSSIVLIALGITRTVLLNYMNYHYQINEYGVHWNFFITLGMLRLIVDFWVDDTIHCWELKRIKIWFKRLLQLLLLTLIIFIAQQFAVVLVGPPSRRIANVVFHTAYLCGYLFIQLLQAWASQTPKFRNNLNKNASIEKEIEEKVPSDDEREALEPSVVDSVNQYGLLFFLLANILTGLSGIKTL
ncbi:Phosphatidylinositol-glycan biosynthesis class W protein [Dirofilaria immitis]|nr:Phosphatidylinositol-glycan biosynthesis class W protein [Dirofilaria immitis]